jgi:hypothetical protein
MHARILRLVLFVPLLAPTWAWSQNPQDALKQRLAEVKRSIAENKTKLKTYHWVETTEMSLKGEVKKVEQNECRYSPDGKVQKTLVGAPAEEKKPRGLKGKIAGKKIDEFKDYMQRFGSLISRYAPPDPQAMQKAFQAGKASIDQSAGGTQASLVFNDYAKSGDKVTLTFDTAAKKLKNYNVATYLDGPEDAVGLDARFSSLDDGTNYLDQVILNSASKQLQIKKTNFDYKKLEP